jgi:hypothetical protein
LFSGHFVFRFVYYLDAADGGQQAVRKPEKYHVEKVKKHELAVFVVVKPKISDIA